MKNLLLIAGVAALGLTAPAAAKPGHGNGHGHGFDNVPVGYGIGGCPPGLAKKHNGCMPPGQAKKLFRVGQRYNTAFGSRYGYGQIPYNLRNQFDLTPGYRYYYDNGYLYQVNPRTMLVQQVISALLGR